MAGLLIAPAAAQRRFSTKPKTPRALALVEWPAKGAPRLVPICILIDGRFYDAGIYKADPVPLALDSGNVYEVEHSGDPEGLFTIHSAAQQGENWFGVGGYSSLKDQKAAAAAPAKPATASEERDEPPRLRRPENEKKSEPSTQPAPPSATAGAPPANSPDSDRPPVLRKPTQESAPAAQPGAAEGTAGSAPASAPAEAEDEQDPNRPRLRRGKPASQIALDTMETPASAVAASAASGSRPPATQGPAALRVLPAISDAKGPQPRSFLFDWTAQEQSQLSAGMQDLARVSLQEYLKGRNLAAGPLQDVQVKAFDLDLSNEAVFVLTATAGPAPPPLPRRTRSRKPEPPAPEPEMKPVTYFVTVVARQNLEGKLRRIFRRVTDSSRLDAYSRLELIDAVDADGDGRGELLFRAINDQARAFVLYRATVDNLTELYNSGELEQ